MNNEIIDNFYKIVSEFIKSFDSNKDYDFTNDKIMEVINNIPKIIEGFKDPSTIEEYRIKAKREDGTLATIQVVDTKTNYMVYKTITANEYKCFYYECLMYSLLYYEFFFKNWIYEIEDLNSGAKNGEFTFIEESLPHILGINKKYLGNCQLLNNIIKGYNNQSVINQILLIISHYSDIMKYENDNNIEIFNYYKGMSKVKDFLLLGRMFNEYDTPNLEGNRLYIIDNENSTNQICLIKKSNMNDNMENNIVKIILQLTKDGKYFPRSIQTVSNELELKNEAARNIWSGVELDNLSDEARQTLIGRGLVIENMPFSHRVNENKSYISPYIFGLGASAPHIKIEEFNLFMSLLGNEYTYNNKIDNRR